MPLFNPSTGFANPMTTEGDIIVGGVAGVPTRLALGAETDVLTAGAATAAWAAGGGGGGGGIWSATDQDFLGWAFPAVVDNGIGLPFTTGQLALTMVKVEKTGVVGHIVFGISAGTIDPTADENFLVIYSPTVAGGQVTDLTLAAQTAPGACDAPFTDTAFVTVALAVPLAVTEGEILYVGFLFNAGAHTLGLYTLEGAPEAYDYGEGPYPFTINSNPGTYTAPPADFPEADFNDLFNWSFWIALAE